MSAEQREEFLARVRQGLAGQQLPPEKGEEEASTWHAPGGLPELVELFTKQLTKVGGQVERVTSAAEARRLLLELVERLAARRVALAHRAQLAGLGLEEALAARGVELVYPLPGSDTAGRRALRDALAGAELGISGADYALAETGTLVMVAGPDNPRLATALPPVHAAVIRPERILPSFTDLASHLRAGPDSSCLTLITGPSRTADIEQTITIGVHGPGELHVIIYG
jgi:L-lactate dehydrogenase complex protein LldG